MLGRSLTWQSLPRTAGTIVREGMSLEFKVTYDPTARAEMAKDVALLANMLGGLLLIGAKETGTGVEYSGLPPDLARKLHDTFDQAVRDFCSPRPIFAVHEIVHPDDSLCVVLALLVEPYPDQPVGAAAPDGSGKPSNAWRFPVRVGSHTKYLQAEQLMLWTNPATRRTAILLSAIPLGSKVSVGCETGHALNVRPCTFDAVLHTWSLEQNFVELRPAAGVPIFRTPLEDVAAVWQSLHDTWSVKLRGRLSDGPNGSPQYFPKP